MSRLKFFLLPLAIGAVLTSCSNESAPDESANTMDSAVMEAPVEAPVDNTASPTTDSAYMETGSGSMNAPKSQGSGTLDPPKPPRR